MNKKLIAVAIAGAFAGASPAVMAGAMGPVKISGFVDSVFQMSGSGCDNAANSIGYNLSTYSNEVASSVCNNGVDVDGVAANSAERKFSTNGEIDFITTNNNVTARIDLDVDGGASAEQALISWMANDSLTVNIGRMNSGVGFEKEDAPDLYQVTHGLIYQTLEDQTSANTGNNVDGVVLAFNAGPAAINVGLLNDLQGANEENSFLLQAAGSPVDGLNLNIALVTQADNTANNASSAENVIDAYATYGMDNWFVNLEILSLSNSANSFPDGGWGLTGHMDFGNGFGATLRYDVITYNDTGAGASVDDDQSTTLAGTWTVNDNLGINLEINSLDVGGTSDKANEALLEAVGTF